MGKVGLGRDVWGGLDKGRRVDEVVKIELKWDVI